MAPLQREIILRMKHETPETEKIPGIRLDVARYAFG